MLRSGMGALGALAAITMLGGSAGAQAPELAPVYGGGDLPLKQALGEEIAKGHAIALVPSGDAMRIRVSIILPCTGGRARASGDDLLLRATLQPDGSFAGTSRVRSDELGSARVAVSGTATADRASGTVDVKSLKGRQRCRSGTRSFVARPVDPNAPLATSGPAPGGALLVGLSSARSSIPFAVVARMSADGRRINYMLHTAIYRCRASGPRARNPTYHYDVQLYGIYPLREGRYARTRRIRETTRERRRGERYSEVNRLSLRVTDAGLRGTRSVSYTAREPGYSERCSLPTHTLRAVPA